jgi:hypothetical protein
MRRPRTPCRTRCLCEAGRDLHRSTPIVQAVPTPVLEYEADRSGKALAGGVRCPALPVRSGNLGRIRDEPLPIRFDDCRELVLIRAVFCVFLGVRRPGATRVTA